MKQIKFTASHPESLPHGRGTFPLSRSSPELICVMIKNIPQLMNELEAATCFVLVIMFQWCVTCICLVIYVSLRKKINEKEHFLRETQTEYMVTVLLP